MKAITKIILLILLAAAIIFAKVYDIDDYLTFENLKKNREALRGIPFWCEAGAGVRSSNLTQE